MYGLPGSRQGLGWVDGPVEVGGRGGGRGQEGRQENKGEVLLTLIELLFPFSHLRVHTRTRRMKAGSIRW